MSNTRIKNKRDKQNLKKRFKDTKNVEKLTYKELKKKEKIADTRNQRRKKVNEELKRQERNYRLLIDNGFKKGYAEKHKSMSDEDIQKAITKKKKRDAKYEKNKQSLIDNGFSVDFAEKNKRLSDKKIKELLTNIEYQIKNHLAIIWYDATGESDLIQPLLETDSMTTRELIEQITLMFEQSQIDIEDSSGFQGIIKIIHSNTAKKLDKEVEKARKVNAKTKHGYNFVVISKGNIFTVRGVAKAMYIGMSRTSLQIQNYFYKEMRYFMSINCPEIYKAIF